MQLDITEKEVSELCHKYENGWVISNKELLQLYKIMCINYVWARETNISKLLRGHLLQQVSDLEDLMIRRNVQYQSFLERR